jgi:AhpD family alkylhydroperoxidase
MPKIHVPDGAAPLTRRVWQLRPQLRAATDAMSDAVFARSELSPRLRELLRMRIAQINGCQVCLAFRDEAAAADGVDEEVLAAVGSPVAASTFSARDHLVIDFAERFALDHHSLDDAYFEMLLEHFDDGEILDLTFCVARFLAFGRLTRVLGLDDECVVAPRPVDSLS